ncbi:MULTISPECIES: hypothetical protein [unclassified Achromobacter]|uniref:hypothetical protein n=1 Tax=unclassified Achromobacter TaxID=2626865 RepID=UPI001178C772|nr:MULTISPECIES: hypothetical protein [unclassified Achromobacter]
MAANSVSPVSPVNASVVATAIGRTYDSVKRGDGVDAIPAVSAVTAGPRARLHQSKVWRSYRKGGFKKQFAQQQRRKSTREEVETFIAAGGAYLATQSTRNQALAKERRERRSSVESAGESAGLLYGDAQPQLVAAQANPVARANQQRVLVEQKHGAAARQQGGRSAAELQEDAARYSAKLAGARETIRDLPVDLLGKAANAPLELVAEITAIHGVRPEDLRRICAEERQKLIRPPINVVHAVAMPQPNAEKAGSDFGELVNFCAGQNDKRVAPRTAIQFGVECVDTITLLVAALSLVRTWPHSGGPVALTAR